MFSKTFPILCVFLFFSLTSGCERSLELVKYSNQIELFGFGGEVDQSALVKGKVLPSFTGREDNVSLADIELSNVAPEGDESKALMHFYNEVREALLLKRELFEGKLKVIEKDAEVQATFSE